MASLVEASASIPILNIVREAIKDLQWDTRRCSDKYILSRMVKIASQSGISYEQLQAKSIDNAKTFQNYEYIEYRKENIKNSTIPYIQPSFIICIDNCDRIWAIFRQRIKNDILTNDAINLLSCLGGVYVYFSKNTWNLISNFPDNVIQISNVHLSDNFYQNLTRLPSYLRGFKDRLSNPAINPFNMMGQNVEYIDTYSHSLENLPPNTKTLIVNFSADETKKNITLSLFPYGIKNITLHVVFTESFIIFPPTVENIRIERLYSQLNGFPMNLKSLTIDYVHNPSICPNESDDNYWYPLYITSDCAYVGEYPCYDCGDDTFLKKYDYTFSNIVFPDGFTTLTLNYSKSYTILKYITIIPTSFNKVIITNYDSEHVIMYPIRYSAISEIITKFKERFPSVEITFIEK